MLTWLSRHKEWLFGGLGTAVVVAILSNYM